MSILKRFSLVLVMFTGLTGLSFGETFYSFTTGLFRVNEQFRADNYVRDQRGINLNFNFYYFPEKFFLGAFAQTSIGTFYSGFESDGQDMVSLSQFGDADIRIAVGPSFKLQAGNKLRFPISVGPVFVMQHDEGNDWESDTDSFYEALSLGVMADAAVVFNPSRWFFLRHGISFEWDFLRTERGVMDSVYRTTKGIQYKGVPYSAFLGSLYFGVGIRFE